jgi:dihydrofolate reductase
MKRIVVLEFLTADGVMESPEKWQFPYLSEDLAKANQAQMLALDSLLLGRVTYEIFASSWPLRTNNEFGIADKLNSMTKYVISSGLETAKWNNSTLIKTNVVNEIAKTKQQGEGDIGIVGSAALIRWLMPYNLIDEYRFLIHPIVLGKGRRLFADSTTLMLKLVETKGFESGVILLAYQPV